MKGRRRSKFKQWLKRPLFCKLGLHDWRDGPGHPCVDCGAHDWFYCMCMPCQGRRMRHTKKHGDQRGK